MITLTKEDGRYIAGLARRFSPSRKAQVTASLGANRYTAMLIDTGHSITVTSGQVGLYAVGKIVSLKVGADGRYSGTTPLIDAASQSSENGVLISLATSTEEKTGETITSLPAYPVQLVVGGPRVGVDVVGQRLSTAPTYGHASIVNAVAQVIEPDLIRLEVKANAGCPLGRYSLTVAGKVITNFFEVV